LSKFLSALIMLVLSACAFIVPASSVNYPSALYYSAIFLVFSGLLLLLIKPSQYTLSKLEKVMLVSWLFYPAVTALDLWFRVGWIWTEFQEPSRFLLVLPIYLMVRRVGFSQNALKWGVWFGAVAAGVWAFYQKQYLGVHRVSGGTSGLIAAFGNISLLLGVMSVAMFQPNWKVNPLFGLLAAVALLLGVYASLASGTKGGWIAMPLLCWVMVDLLDKPTYKKRFLVLFAFAFSALLVWYFVPFVQQRLSVIIPAITEYFVHGKVAEGSAGIRLALWHAALLIFIDNPLFGTGPGSYYIEKLPLVEAGLVPPEAGPHLGPHNQLLNSLFETGIVGAIMVYSIYASFLLLCRQHLQQNKALATSGVLMVVGYMDFGIAEVIWDINNAGVFFAVMMAMIAGKLSHDQAAANTTAGTKASV
jgi:O-antigen ligase